MTEHNCSAGLCNGGCEHESHEIRETLPCGAVVVFNPTFWETVRRVERPPMIPVPGKPGWNRCPTCKYGSTEFCDRC